MAKEEPYEYEPEKKRREVAGPDDPWPVINEINGKLYNLKQVQVQVTVHTQPTRKSLFSIPIESAASDMKNKLLGAALIGLTVLAVPVTMAIWKAAPDAGASGVEKITDEASTGKGSPKVDNMAGGPSGGGKTGNGKSSNKSLANPQLAEINPATANKNFSVTGDSRPQTATQIASDRRPLKTDPKSLTKPAPTEQAKVTKPEVKPEAKPDQTMLSEKPKTKTDDKVASTYRGPYSFSDNYKSLFESSSPKTAEQRYTSVQPYPGSEQKPSGGGGGGGGGGGSPNNGAASGGSSSGAGSNPLNIPDPKTTSDLASILSILSNPDSRNNPPSASPISP